MAELIKEFLDGFQKLLEFTASNSLATVVLTAGLILLVITLLCAYKALNTSPEQAPRGLSVILYSTLIAGIFFTVAGPLISILGLIPGSRALQPLSVPQAIERLKLNDKVTWLVRLVPYNLRTRDLSVDRLTNLGRPQQMFTFVADYNELRGRLVSKSVELTGGSLQDQQGVSVIIFPLRGKPLYPANAGGLLQAINRIESGNNSINKPFHVINGLRYELEQKDMTKTDDPNYWSWGYYGQFYPDYCSLAQTFRCDEEYSARSLLGGRGSSRCPRLVNM
jgi:hypothetical protein